jgi:hypothetical protein
MLFGAEILAATTISGTMVMGLAPVFLLQRFVRYSVPRHRSGATAGPSDRGPLRRGWSLREPVRA